MLSTEIPLKSIFERCICSHFSEKSVINSNFQHGSLWKNRQLRVIFWDLFIYIDNYFCKFWQIKLATPLTIQKMYKSSISYEINLTNKYIFWANPGAGIPHMLHTNLKSTGQNNLNKWFHRHFGAQQLSCFLGIITIRLGTGFRNPLAVARTFLQPPSG